MTLFPQPNSWIFGTHISGKRNAVTFHMVVIGAYRQKLGEVAGAGYEGVATTREREVARV